MGRLGLSDIRITISEPLSPDGKSAAIDAVQALNDVSSAELVPMRSLGEWSMVLQCAASVAASLFSILTTLRSEMPEGTQPSAITIELKDGTRISGDLSMDEITSLLEIHG